MNKLSKQIKRRGARLGTELVAAAASIAAMLSIAAPANADAVKTESVRGGVGL